MFNLYQQHVAGLFLLLYDCFLDTQEYTTATKKVRGKISSVCFDFGFVDCALHSVFDLNAHVQVVCFVCVLTWRAWQAHWCCAYEKILQYEKKSTENKATGKKPTDKKATDKKEGKDKEGGKEDVNKVVDSTDYLEPSTPDDSIVNKSANESPCKSIKPKATTNATNQ